MATVTILGKKYKVIEGKLGNKKDVVWTCDGKHVYYIDKKGKPVPVTNGFCKLTITTDLIGSNLGKFLTTKKTAETASAKEMSR